jgi:hypothetical protein
MEQYEINQHIAEINNKKCYSCGKEFRTPNDYQRHKNRKTPCLIREVPPDQIANPNRCIFCNKIFVNRSSMIRHLKICKVKNGGMDMLVDKVRYDQEIRILKEQREADARNREDDKEQIRRLMDLQQAQAAEIDALKKAIAAPQTVNYNAPITNNNTFNITINNYTTPTIAGITITQGELDNVTKLSKFLLEKLYFNPAAPENHCIYLKNLKDKSLIVFDNNKWEAVCGENTGEVITKLSNSVYGNGVNLLNGDAGPYGGVDGNFVKLLPAVQRVIKDFNTSTDTLTNDDAYEVFLGGRQTVLDTIRAAGCKLV